MAAGSGLSPEAIEARKPFQDLMGRMHSEESFTSRQYAAHALAQMLVSDVREDSRTFALGLDYFRENDPSDTLVALGENAESLEDVVTLQLVLSCITNLAARDGTLGGGRKVCTPLSRAGMPPPPRSSALGVQDNPLSS